MKHAIYEGQVLRADVIKTLYYESGVNSWLYRRISLLLFHLVLYNSVYLFYVYIFLSSYQGIFTVLSDDMYSRGQ